MRSCTAAGVGAARRSAGWAFFFVLVVVATAPAYAAFAQLVRLESPSLGSFDAALIVLSLPDIAQLLPAISALIAIGALAAVLAAATSLLFAIASTTGHDFYGGILDRKGPSGRRLIVTRVILIAAAAFAGWQAMQATDQVFALAATSASLAASGLFPALVLGIWWKRATALGALAGILFGFAAAAAYVWMVVYGDMAPWRPLGTAGPGLPPMAAAFFGLPVGMLAVVLVSQITPTPSSERIEILDDIRRPTPSPIFDI
jgi:cation/acetate symporter